MKKPEDYLLSTHKLIDSAGPASGAGKYSLLLYYYALYNALGDEKFGLKVRTYLGELIDKMLLEELSIFPSVMALGILEDVREKGFIHPDAENKIILLDDFLFRKVISLLQSRPWESWDAIIGILNYYSERPQNERIQYYQQQLIAVLGQLFSPLWTSGDQPYGMNLGIVDGMTGVLLGLVKATSKLPENKVAMEIVREGILYILSYRRERDYAENRHNIFPDYVPADRKKASYSNQLSWSNSDLTRSLLFYRAFALFKDEELKKMADLVGLNTLLRKDFTSTDITDSHFCRGSSGVVQTYKTLYELSHYKGYLDGCKYWIKYTEEMLERELERNFFDGKEGDFLYGLTGTTLTIMSYYSEKELHWSKCFLL